MELEQLTAEIFDNYEEKHMAILGDALSTSRKQAERIIAKYNTRGLSKEDIESLKNRIVKKEVDNFMKFVEQNKDILDAPLTDEQKFNKLFARHNNPAFSKQKREYVKNRIRRHINDDNVGKILIKLADDLKI